MKRSAQAACGHPVGKTHFVSPYLLRDCRSYDQALHDSRTGSVGAATHPDGEPTASIARRPHIHAVETDPIPTD